MVKSALTIERRIAIAFGISLSVSAVELAGGLLSGSLALLSDAGHVIADAAALGLSWYALRLSRRHSSGRATFGYHRAGVMVALINGGALIIMAFLIFSEAYRRFLAPPMVNTTTLLAVASIGLLANLITVWILQDVHQHSLNVKSAWLHVLGDSLASVGVIISGIIALVTGWRYADPIVSVLIGALILVAGLKILRDSGAVFLELAPSNIDSDDVLRAMREVPGVRNVHDFHLWMITPQIVALAAHVQVEENAVNAPIFAELQKRLQDMGIVHTTLQLERQDCSSGDTFCHLAGAVKQEKHTP
jgi:cobalt-zinc-cadmium efflux system protein